jgi:hypothetical protein
MLNSGSRESAVVCCGLQARAGFLELTRFGGHPDTWDHEFPNKVTNGPQVYPPSTRVPSGWSGEEELVG